LWDINLQLQQKVCKTWNP